jgi:hypothetical protein
MGRFVLRTLNIFPEGILAMPLMATLKKAWSKALGGGVAGAVAMVLQVRCHALSSLL